MVTPGLICETIMHAYAGNDYVSSRNSLLVTDDYVQVVQPRMGKTLHQEAAWTQALAREALQASFTRLGWHFLFLEDLITVSVTPVSENQTLVTQVRRRPEFTSVTGLRRLIQRLTRPSMDALFVAYLRAFSAQLKETPDTTMSRPVAMG
jgi:hypothetical protein